MSTDWLSEADVGDRLDHLVEIVVVNSAGTPTTLRFSRRGTTTPPYTTTSDKGDTLPASTEYEKRIIEAPSITQSMWGPNKIGGSTFVEPDKLILGNADGGLDAYSPTEGYRWGGQLLTYYVVDRYEPTLSPIRIFRGLVSKANFGLDVVTVPFKSRDAVFDKLTSSRVYRGTGPWLLELNSIAGGTSRVDFGTPAKIDNLTGNMTVELWAWFENFGSATIVLYGPAGGTSLPWRLLTTSTGGIVFQGSIGGSVTDVNSTTSNMSLRTWYHISVTISGRNVTFHLWNEATQTEQTSHHVNAFASATRDTQVGITSYQLRTASSRSVWVDDVRAWNVHRSIEDIRDTRHQPFDAADLPTNLVHYLPINDGSSTTVTDITTSPANGTITLTGAGAFTWIRSPEGGSDMAGVPKPDLWGWRYRIDPVLIDDVEQIYQIAASGAIQGNSIVISEGGSTLGLFGTPPYTDAASMRAFLTTALSSGAVLVYSAAGMFKLGSAPTFPITAQANGYNDGSAGNTEYPHAMIVDLITRTTDLTTTDLDMAVTIDRLDDDFRFPMGLYLKSPSTVRKALERITDSLGAYFGWIDSDELSFPLFEGAVGKSITAVFTERDIVDISPLDLDIHLHEYTMLYKEADRVLSQSETAGSVNPTEWNKRWQEHKLRDPTVLGDFPPPASRPSVVETLYVYLGYIYNILVATSLRQGAAFMARRWFDIFKRRPEAYRVTMRQSGFVVGLGQIIGLSYTTQSGDERLGLDGTRPWVVITKTLRLQRGVVELTVLGWVE